jgi:D-glycero-D-manno-heptose 1,7-bisphosphate phosphatase
MVFILGVTVTIYNLPPLLYSYSDRVLKVNEKVVILDRDGVINVDTGHPYKIEDMKFTNFFCNLMPILRDLNAYLIVCTNQSGIGRGLFTQLEMENFNFHLYNETQTAFSYSMHSLIACPHTPNDNCFCRKPKAGMLNLISEKFNVSKDNLLFIGDSNSDFLAARVASVAFRFVNAPNLSLQISKWYRDDNC